MKTSFLLRYCYALLPVLLLKSNIAQAQGPTIDPSFQATAVYKPASIDQVLEQPDGKRLVLSSAYADAILRAGNRPAGKVVRLQANSNEPDSVFTRNVRGLQGQVRMMVLMPTGQVLLLGYNALTLGVVTRQFLLRLNADGTPDAGFDAGFAASSTLESPVFNGVGQPDGKLVLTFVRPLLSGAGRLVRLLPNGALDTAFQTALSGSVPSTAGLGGNVVLQPDGKLLLPAGNGANGPLRLLPTGAWDATFAPQLALPAGVYASQVAVQPDGKVLVATYDYNTGVPRPLLRLTATGAADPTFQSGANFNFSIPFPQAPQVQVQPDGKLLVSSLAFDASGAFISWVVRLLPTGALDNGFSTAASLGPDYTYVNYTQLLPSGQLLVVRQVGNLRGFPLLRPVLLNADGSQDPTFAPRLFSTGQVNDVVRLPGGDYVVGGKFSEINGVAAGNLARLSAAGVPTPGFAAADGEVRSLRLQPDGKLLVGGTFEHLAGSSRRSLGRLLPSGSLDAGFAPPFLSTTYLTQPSSIGRVEVLPDGRVLAAGTTKLSATGRPETWLRVLDGTTGLPDLAWPHYQATDLVVQPGGGVVVAGFDTVSTQNPFRGTALFRLLPSGGLDPSFTPLPTLRTGYGGGPVVSSLAQSTTGNLYFTVYYYTDAGTPLPARLCIASPDGPILNSVPNARFAEVVSLAVQPNGRVLVGADLNSTTATFGLSRVLPTLTVDPSFASASGPAPTVNRLLVQPDGAIMAAGSFTQVGGQAISGLARFLDASVLSVPARQTDLRTQAWPVPTHGPLHLRLDAASQPQRIELLDALGRAVLSQAVHQPELTLDTTALPVGAYVLRVHYANGPVTKRVVLE